MSNLPSAEQPPSLHIVAVGRYRLGRVLERLSPEIGTLAQVEVLTEAFEDAVAAVRALHVQAPIDAIVAAGASGDWLRKNVDIPVAMVEVRGFDLMRALAQARAVSPRVGLVSFDGPSEHLAQLDALFGMGIRQFSYHGPADAPACVEALLAAGVEAVVAPGLVCDLAEQAGMASVLMYSDEAVRQALDDAVRLARLGRTERARHERMNTVFGQLQDGVLAVDLRQHIEALNPAMAQLLNAPASALQGRELPALEPALDLGAALRLDAMPSEEVVQLATRTLVVRRAPIIENGVLTGALLVCRDPAAIQRADRHLRASQRHRGAATAQARHTIDAFAGDSAAARRVRELAGLCAASDATVLVTGESGTGKELVAQGIHSAGRRAGQPFLAVNCAALAESLLESELFGYDEGAFTGARRGGKTGLIEAAHTGTLFLDEIGDMPLALQTRLLRVLQEREVLRIGATVPLPVDLRVIAATHADLAAQVDRGLFRRDLYYRLAVLRVATPALRERREDVAGLARRMLEKRAHQPAAASALDALLALAADYPWPGNVRELENMVERLLACHAYIAPGPRAQVDRARLSEVFPECVLAQPPAARQQLLKEGRQAAEARRVREVLASVHGDQRQACLLLGISRATLWRRLRTEKAGA